MDNQPTNQFKAAKYLDIDVQKLPAVLSQSGEQSEPTLIIKTSLQKSLGTAAIAIAIFITSSISTLAADDSTTNGSNTEIDEIIVTATKRSASLRDLPMSIEAFNSEQLSERGVQNINDLQYQAAGLRIGEYQGKALVSIRGIGNQQLSEGAEGGAALHLDGVYLGSRFDQSRGYFDLERVEVLRGPQGTLYGRNATGGAINIITRAPTEAFEGGFKTTIGNYNLGQFEGFLSGPLVDNNILGRVAVKLKAHDGFTQNLYNGERYDNADVASIRAKLKFVGKENFSADLVFDLNKDDGVQVAHTERFDPSVPAGGEAFGGFLPTALSADQRVVAHDADTFQEIETEGASLRLAWDFENATLTSLTAYRSMSYLGSYDVDYTDYNGAYFREFVVNSDQMSQEFNLASIGTGSLQWILGAFYFEQESDSHIYMPVPGQFGGYQLFFEAPEITADAYALYGEVNYEISDRLKVDFGARYSREKKTLIESQYIPEFFFYPPEIAVDDAWTDFTPKVAVTYDLDDNSMFYATISKGFKAGGVNTFALQDSAFDAEKVTNYEAGLKRSYLDSKFNVDLSIFRMDYTDLQVFQITNIAAGTGTNLSINTVTNAGSSIIQGIELGFQARPTERISIDGNISFLDATYDELELTALKPGADGQPQNEDVSGNRLAGAPEWSANLGVTYAMDVGEWGTARLRGEYSFQDQVYFRPHNEDRVSQDAYSLANLRLIFLDRESRWQYTLYAENLTDELIVAHQNLSSGVPYDLQNIFMPPRTYGLSVNLNY